MIVVFKQLFTRIYWCFVINYRFKIVQIVTLGPMTWPLDQYLTLLTNDFNTWPLNQWRETKARPSEQWPVVSTDCGAVGTAQISTLCFRFKRENMVKNYNTAVCDTVTQTSWCIVESCLSYSWFSLCWTCRNQRNGANSLLLQNTLLFTN